MHKAMRLVTILSIAALAITACAAEDNDESEEGLASEAGADASEDEPASEGDVRDDVDLTIAGAGAGAPAAVMSGLLADYLRTHAEVPGVAGTSQTTGGLVENTRLLEAGEVDFGLVGGTQLWVATNSTGPFEGEDPYENLRPLFPIYETGFLWLTFDDDIDELADFAGKRVNIGPPGSAFAQLSEITLTAAGVWDDVDVENQDWAEGVRLMQDGLVDAIPAIGPNPMPAVQEAAAVPGHDLKVLPIDDATMDTIRRDFPELNEIPMEANLHADGVPAEDTVSVGYYGYLVANKDLDDDVVYDVMSAYLSEDGQTFLVDNFAGFALGFEQLPGFEHLEPLGVPLHPGAIQYWEDQGETVPDSLKPTG